MIKHISSKIENPTRSFPFRVKIHFRYKYMLLVYSAQPKRYLFAFAFWTIILISALRESFSYISNMYLFLSLLKGYLF